MLYRYGVFVMAGSSLTSGRRPPVWGPPPWRAVLPIAATVIACGQVVDPASPTDAVDHGGPRPASSAADPPPTRGERPSPSSPAADLGDHRGSSGAGSGADAADPETAEASLFGAALPRQGAWPTVLDRLDANDVDGALRAWNRLSSRAKAQPAIRFLGGMLHERRSEIEEALILYANLEDALPDALHADLARRRARLLVRAGRCAEATPLLAPMATERGVDAAMARALLAECAVAAERWDEAKERLTQVNDEDAVGVDTFASRVMLAQVHLALGDPARARRELRDLYIARPGHPEADALVAEIEALGGPINLDIGERLARAERLLRFRRHDRVLAELAGMAEPRRRGERALMLHLRGMALYGKRRHYDEAAPVLGAAARLGGRHGADDAFHAARALARAGKASEAMAAYRRFVRDHGEHRLAAEAEYLAAQLEVARRRATGERSLRRFLDGPRARANPSLARDAAWQLAFSAFEARRYTAAAERMGGYAALSPDRPTADPMVKARGLYWRGRALHLAGQPRAAIVAYRAAAAVEPLHWYALWARRRIREIGEEPGDPFAESDGAVAELAPLPPLTPPGDVAFYARIGLRSEAIAALRSQEDGVEGQAPAGRGLEALAALYHVLGHASRPYQKVVRQNPAELRQRPDGNRRWIWQAAYPRPYERALVEVSEGQRFPPELLWAVMRQESSYNPEAVSYADAIGLVQLMPATAARVAEGLGVPVTREMLFDPELNVRLGGTYLGGLLRGFEGQIPLALAGYNAGGQRARQWAGGATRVPEDDLDLYVERIPIDQTRNYVRRVSSHYAHYRYLYSRQGNTGAGPEVGDLGWDEQDFLLLDAGR